MTDIEDEKSLIDIVMTPSNRLNKQTQGKKILKYFSIGQQSADDIEEIVSESLSSEHRDISQPYYRIN